MGSIDDIIDRLSGPGATSRPRTIVRRPGLVFGGDTIFAIAHGGGRIFLKVDEQSKPVFESRGMGTVSARTSGRRSPPTTEVPPEVLADPEALLSWAGGGASCGPDHAEPPGEHCLGDRRMGIEEQGSTADLADRRMGGRQIMSRPAAAEKTSRKSLHGPDQTTAEQGTLDPGHGPAPGS